MYKRQLSPLIGLILGFIMMCITLRVFHKQHPVKVEGLFKAFQLFSSAIFSLGHGANDAQKTMGIIAILLFSVAGSNEFVGEYLYENTGQFHVPLWLIITCYSVIALGTIIGGKKVIKTLGDGLAKLKPVQGFCAVSYTHLDVYKRQGEIWQDPCYSFLQVKAGYGRE